MLEGVVIRNKIYMYVTEKFKFDCGKGRKHWEKGENAVKPQKLELRNL